MEAARPLGDRERFVAFAFAAADLLVEVAGDGRIRYAAGAFRQRLGREAEAFVGGPPADIVAAEDQEAFTSTLALMPTRGRLPPTAFRLNDTARTAFAVAGLYMPHGDEGRICLTFAPLPCAPNFRAADSAALARIAAERVRGGEGASLSLIEVQGASAAVAGEVESVLTRESGGALAAQIAPGKFGLMQEAGAPPPDLAAIARGMEASLGEGGEAVTINLAARLDLAAGELSPAQAARALRHGLSVFARLGAEGLKDAGFENGLEGVVANVATRAGSLRRAVAERRFRLDFQPIVDLATRVIHHHEALLRPGPGVLQPGEGPQDFANLAETIGLTEELDLAVAAVTLAATPAVEEGRHLAFNISGLSAQSEGFREKLLALLDRDGRAAARVMVELTESAEIENEAAAAETLAQLRARGVAVCLDDFGAGAAAFRYLRAFPVDYVKVDGSYVVGAMTSERDRSFVAAMVDLSSAVGARVVAEHIEDEAAARAMQALGVHYGQGWLFGKPGPL